MLKQFMRLIALSTIFISGCGSTSWYKAGANQEEFFRDKSYCQALSTGVTPMDYSYHGPTTTYYSGTIYDSSIGNARYFGTSTAYNSSSGQDMYNLGQTLQRKNIFNDCMRGRGYISEKDNFRKADFSTLKGNVPVGLEKKDLIDEFKNKHQVSLMSQIKVYEEPHLNITGKYGGLYLGGKAIVNVTEEKNGFSKILARDGMTGWVQSEFLEKVID